MDHNHIKKYPRVLSQSDISHINVDFYQERSETANGLYWIIRRYLLRACFEISSFPECTPLPGDLSQSIKSGTCVLVTTAGYGKLLACSPCKVL